jgi:pimeloyl-ACP methyl ester carboxylesterase
MTSSDTQYAQNGNVSIAYRVSGSGSIDVIVVPGIVSHVEAFDALPGYASFIDSIARAARVITFDKRGNGLSDRVAEPPSLEDRMDDVRAVLDACGSERAVLFGISEGGPMCLLFAAAHPKRTAALVLFGAFARVLAAPGYPDGLPADAYEAFTEQSVDAWGTGAPLLQIFGPSLSSSVQATAAKCERASATPTALRALWRMNASIDVRDVVSRIDAPALVMHRIGDRVIPGALSRWLAAHLPKASLVPLDGDDHFPFVGDTARVVRELSTFLDATGLQVQTLPALAATIQDPAVLDATDLGRLVDAMQEGEPLELGRFVVERPLGSGAMGTVYLATDRDLGRSVALKVLHATDADAFRRFRREAIAIARLSHPNVVAIHELGLDAPTPYLVMEHVPGGALSGLGAIPWARAVRLVACAARGLGAAHARGIVHRDVKPGNLLLVDRDGDIAKVADFGVAKVAGADALTKENALVGTVGYLSPEQIGGESVDARADVYALGVTLYRLLTGRTPFAGTVAEVLAASYNRSIPDPRAIAKDTPPSIAELVQHLSAIDPKARPLDGAAAAAELEAAIGARS